MTCHDCRKRGLPLMAMLADSVWPFARDEVACWDCTEKRLHRRILVSDLKICPLTLEDPRAWFLIQAAIAGRETTINRRLRRKQERKK